MAYKKKPKKQKQKIASAIAHVKSTFNNTIVSITTMEGDVLFSSSAGRLGFKGSRKSTPFAASQIASTLAKEMQLVGVKNCRDQVLVEILWFVHSNPQV
jgi:small subunit ribosomal protein S11